MNCFSDNKDIYNFNYTEANVRLAPETKYDKEMINKRFEKIDRYGQDKDILDLCCGSGSYLIPRLHLFKSAVGLDFSSNMLNAFRARLNHQIPPNLKLIEGDAQSLKLQTESFDFVFSYTALYYVPQLEKAIREISRVLRPGGIVALELGNYWSLNTAVCYFNHRNAGWAKGFHVSVSQMLDFLKGANLEVLSHERFQILPMYGCPRPLFFLRPLLSKHWKKLLGIKIGKKMLDQRISEFWPFSAFAFRHFFVAKKLQ